MWYNSSKLAQNARDVGSIPALATIFPVLVTPTTLVALNIILYKLRVVGLLNLPCVWHCLYVCNCKH